MPHIGRPLQVCVWWLVYDQKNWKLVSNCSLPQYMDRLSYFTRVCKAQIKSYQIQCHEQSQQSGVHLHLFLNIVYVANSLKIFCQIFFACLIFKMRAHYKKYVIHMSLTHFYPVHQNAVFILNVKMPFMSLYMSPFKLLFLNDIGICFASLKIYWGIWNTIPNSSFWGSPFCLLLGKVPFAEIILSKFPKFSPSFPIH